MINHQSLNAFLLDSNSHHRLHVKNNALRYDANVGCFTLFAAKLGFGSASMSNVAKFIRKNQDTCFCKNVNIETYNAFIASYNDKQSICWKKAKKVKTITACAEDLDPHARVKQHLANCKILAKRSDVEALTEHCTALSESLKNWQIGDEITKKEKKTLNKVIAFKNQTRASFLPQKDKPLKGGTVKPIAINEPTEDLSCQLKEIRATTLKKYFSKRLEADQEQLDSLKWRFETNKDSFQKVEFLEGQLDRWQKRIDQGKPIAIPKWYHCTKTAETTEKILDTSILYMKQGAYAGAFVSNRPEVETYGNYCLMLSDRIEKTGTKEPGSKDPVYPKQSNFCDTYLHYSDTPVPSKDQSFIPLQDFISIWLGFQRGKKTLSFWTGWGTEGIPMERQGQIKNGNLKYYKDTSVAFIFSQDDDPTLTQVGQQTRVPVLKYDEAEALRSLISATFYFTLPSDWEGNIKHCYSY